MNEMMAITAPMMMNVSVIVNTPLISSKSLYVFRLGSDVLALGVLPFWVLLTTFLFVFLDVMGAKIMQNFILLQMSFLWLIW